MTLSETQKIIENGGKISRVSWPPTDVGTRPYVTIGNSGRLCLVNPYYSFPWTPGLADIFAQDWDDWEEINTLYESNV
jgi:hypothetical protein